MSNRDTTMREWEPGSSTMGSSTDWDVQSQGGDSATDTAKQAAPQAQEQAGAKADAGMETAAGGMHAAADMMRERGQSMGGSTGGAAAMAADKLDMASQYLHGKDTDQIMTDLESLVRRKPVESLAVAAGIGFLLSKALR